MLSQYTHRIYSLYPDLVPFIGLFEGDDAKFLYEKLCAFPKSMWPAIMKCYTTYESRREKNKFLRTFVQSVTADMPNRIRSLDVGSEEIKSIAARYAKEALRIARDPIYERLDRDNNPYTYTRDENSDKILYTKLASFMNSQNLAPPDAHRRSNYAACIRKMLSVKTWQRALLVKAKRKREQAHIHLQKVNRKHGLYISDFGANKRKFEKEANERFLANNYMKNSSGEVVSLLTLSNATVANPVNRRNELMTRLSGAERIANERGDVGLFLTITCPSRFHSSLSSTCEANPKWDGSTPRDANKYLNTLWQRVRAQTKREIINMYGIRISEPQHDATPHWHILVFVAPHHEKRLTEIFRAYALADSPHEPGAKKYRFDVEKIDKGKGSAAAYVAKYISKNIDGFGLEPEDDQILIKAFRVEAWASCWGIRQFQSFGMPPVSPYRELRRVRTELPKGSPFYCAHKAADLGDFAGYVMQMGGICAPSRELRIKLLYEPKFNTDSGEISLSRYEHEPLFRLIGLRSGTKNLLTRNDKWTRCSKSGAA